MKLLARSSSNEITHIDMVSRGKVTFSHLVDKTLMKPKRFPFTTKGFAFDVNSQRAARSGIGIEVLSPQHEMAQYVFSTMKRWRFQFRDEIYSVKLERVFDDSAIRCGSGFVHVDTLMLLDSDSPHYSQFRGRLLILINSHLKQLTELNTKRLALLKDCGFFVASINLPLAACAPMKGKLSSGRLNLLQADIEAFLSSTPTITFPIKPGWCEGVRIGGEQLGVASITAPGSLDFSKIPPKKSVTTRFVEKLSALLGAT